MVRLGVATAAAIAAVALGAAFADADVGPAGFDNGDPMVVPLRWCALQGTSAVTNPGAVGEPDTDSVLWRRQERASDYTWIPGAGITFRSAMAGNVAAQADFPVIPDPFPPGDNNPATSSATDGPGVLGDILDYQFDDPRGPAPGSSSSKSRELDEALQECDAAWNQLEVQFGTNLEGPLALNVNRHVDLNGNETYVGLSSFAFSGTGSLSTVCTALTAANPMLAGTNTSDAFSAVKDNAQNFTPSTKDILTAHELGHVLFLGHGNGLDDDGDNRDDGCDGSWGVPISPPDETSNDPRGLMHPAGGEGITPRQRKYARAVARITAGSTFDPPGKLEPVPVVADHRVELPDKDAPRTAGGDLTSAGMAVNRNDGTVFLTDKVSGGFSEKVRGDYATAIDLDNDPATGGSPTEVGVDTDLRGAELVTVATLNGLRKDPVAKAWKFAGERWVEIPGILASFDVSRRVADFAREPRISFNPGSALTVTIPGREDPLVKIKPPDLSNVKFETLADTSRAGGRIDRLPKPGSSDSKERTLRLTPPDYPTCGSEGTVDPGSDAHVTARGLPPGSDVHVLLGPVEVGKATVGDRGELDFKFPVKRGERPGRRLITIGVNDKAYTADCILTIAGKAPPGTPRGFGDQGGASDSGGGFRWWLIVLLAVLGLLVVAVVARRGRR